MAGEEKAKEYQQKRMAQLNGAVIDVVPQEKKEVKKDEAEW